VYKENLDIHEKGCLERSSTQSGSRYLLPIELQRNWIGAREHKWAEGKRWHEWSAGLKIVGERIEWLDFKQGGEKMVFIPSLSGVSNPVGTVHLHPHPIGPSWTDIINWIWSAMKKIPDDLNPIFFITFFDDMCLAHVLPKPSEVSRMAREEWENESKVRKTFEMLSPQVERLGHAAQVNAWITLGERGMIERRYFRLGDSDQEFSVG